MSRCSLSLVMLLAAGLLACAQPGAWPADDLPTEASARIAPERNLYHRLFIERIDGKELGVFRDSAKLLPGPHEVEAALSVPGRELLGRLSLRFEAEAGRSYELRGGWGWYGAHLWIVDTQTQDRVANAETPGPALPQVGAKGR